MALRSTQTLKEMSSRNIFWGYTWPVRRVDKLTTIILEILEPHLTGTLNLYRDCFTFALEYYEK
jgi:hypothetical protein